MNAAEIRELGALGDRFVGSLRELLNRANLLVVDRLNDWSSENKRTRRERIATAALAGLSNSPLRGDASTYARVAVEHADALIAELDRETAR